MVRKYRRKMLMYLEVKVEVGLVLVYYYKSGPAGSRALILSPLRPTRVKREREREERGEL